MQIQKISMAPAFKANFSDELIKKMYKEINDIEKLGALELKLEKLGKTGDKETYITDIKPHYIDEEGTVIPDYYICNMENKKLNTKAAGIVYATFAKGIRPYEEIIKEGETRMAKNYFVEQICNNIETEKTYKALKKKLPNSKEAVKEAYRWTQHPTPFAHQN